MEIRTQRAGNALIVALNGELDAYWADETERELWGHIDRGCHWLVLDLAGLSYLSSGGLRVLLRTHHRLTALGGQMLVAEPQPYVRDVLAVSGLAQALPLFDTVREALGIFAAAAPDLDAAWAGAQRHETGYGEYRLRPCGEGRGVLHTVGDVADHLFSRATAERLTGISLSDLGYGLAVGASAESASAAVERLGEMLTLPGSIFWLPGDGRQAPDFLTADLGGARLPVYLLNGLWLSGEPQFYGRFTAADAEAGVTLQDWSSGLWDWAAHQAHDAVRQAVGVALRADLAEMWGVGLKRSPRAGHAPANGQEISHRENITDWLHFPTEATFSNYTLLSAGLLAAAEPAANSTWSAILGAPERRPQATLRVHLHGAAFRPVPQLGGAATLDGELRHVARQGELAGVAHLLPNTRLRSAQFGVWLLEGGVVCPLFCG